MGVQERKERLVLCFSLIFGYRVASAFECHERGAGQVGQRTTCQKGKKNSPMCKIKPSWQRKNECGLKSKRSDKRCPQHDARIPYVCEEYLLLSACSKEDARAFAVSEVAQARASKCERTKASRN